MVYAINDDSPTNNAGKDMSRNVTRDASAMVAFGQLLERHNMNITINGTVWTVQSEAALLRLLRWVQRRRRV